MAMTEIRPQKSLALYRVWLLNYVTAFLEERVQNLEELMNADERIVNRMNRLADTIRELEEELGHKPSVEELSAFLELPTEEIRNLLRVAEMDLPSSE
jgi:RNA polymerase primary sigma factor